MSKAAKFLFPGMVTGVEFSIGEIPGGYDSVVIQRQRKKATACVINTRESGDEPLYFWNLEADEWQKVMNRLFMDVQVQHWEREYSGEDGAGCQWRLDFRMKWGRHYTISGDGAFPEKFEAVEELFRWYITRKELIGMEKAEFNKCVYLFSDGQEPSP